MKSGKFLFPFVVGLAAFIMAAALYILFVYKTEYLRIYVVYYKPAPLVKSETFVPIQAGRAIENTPSRQGVFSAEDLAWLHANTIGDDTGENISELNRYFAEVTALYWIYKNTTSPFVGMFQYRRFLSIAQHPRYPTVTFPSMRFYHLGIKHLAGFADSFLRNLELQKKFILPWFATHDILVSEPIKRNAYEQYKADHVIGDLDKALEIIKQKYPDMYDFAVENLHSEEGFYPANLFITRREILNDYVPWLFSILFPVYEEIKEDLATRDTEQKLAMAYLSERLFTIYVRYHQKVHHLRVKEFQHALASDFFMPPNGAETVTLKTAEWEDVFLNQNNGWICSFNNPYRHCGKYDFQPNNRLKVRWGNGGTSYFKPNGSGVFVLEK